MHLLVSLWLQICYCLLPSSIIAELSILQCQFQLYPSLILGNFHLHTVILADIFLSPMPA